MLAHSERPPISAQTVRRLALVGGFAIAVYVAVVLLADAPALFDALSRMRGEAFLLALALIVAVYVVRSLRWRLYLAHLGVLAPAGPIGFWTAFAMGVPQGKWGQLVKAWALRTRARTSYPRALPPIFAERVSDVLGGVLHVAVGLAVVPGASPHALVAALAFIALVVALLRSATIARWLTRALAFVPWVARHAADILDAQARMRGLLTARRLAAPSTMALAAFLLESLALWAIASPGMGADVTIAEAILILAIVDVAATLSFLPGGIGAAEGSLLLLLSLEGVALPEAAAITLAFRAAALWFGVGLGVAATGALALRTRPLPAGAAP